METIHEGQCINTTSGRMWVDEVIDETTVNAHSESPYRCFQLTRNTDYPNLWAPVVDMDFLRTLI